VTLLTPGTRVANVTIAGPSKQWKRLMSDKILTAVIASLVLVLLLLIYGIATLGSSDRSNDRVLPERHHASIGQVVFRSEGGMTRINPAVACATRDACELVDRIAAQIKQDIQALGGAHPVSALETTEGKQRLQTALTTHVQQLVQRNTGDPSKIVTVFFDEIVSTTID